MHESVMRIRDELVALVARAEECGRPHVRSVTGNRRIYVMATGILGAAKNLNDALLAYDLQVAQAQRRTSEDEPMRAPMG